MQNVNNQFILSMLIILLGYILKRINILKESDGDTFSRIIFNITLPSLVINTFSAITVDFSLGLLPVINIIYCTLIAFFSLFIFRNRSRKTKGMLSMVSIGFNIGLFVYPLVEALWGEAGIKYFGMFDMGNGLSVFGISYIIASYYSSDEVNIDYKQITYKLLHSIPLLTYIVTLAVNLSGLHFPSVFLDVTKTLSRANMPLSLLLLGLYLDFTFDKSHWKNILQLLSIRYAIGLGVGILLYFIIPFEPLFRSTLLLGFILPIGTVVIAFAVQFDYDKKFAGTLTNLTNIISFSLIWLICNVMFKV
jgi:malate permease and related proteins